MFPNRLKALRNDKNLNFKQLANNLNQMFPNSRHNNTAAQIGNWERGVRSPSYFEIKKLATYFNVSMDYLSGRNSIQHLELDSILMSDNQIKFNDKNLSKNDRYEIFQLIKGYLHSKQENNNDINQNNMNDYQETLNIKFK
ncbi:helix-turn-helix domain-containing protein [Apilactobacillus apisilvae]|uniref:Helix-turn-helix domain-containing protein n=1 Tax=Apilactobacillus apisilvae TaxID=2923364 RepID=A0ABY4PFS8_9LACO|nr:helix-turn-helix transcriptional regulator [Apilactobacillus apisilvae]UQS84554.1 helix-turn-helix domain-containing protein [Apilactobacillus apisilvae]